MCSSKSVCFSNFAIQPACKLHGQNQHIYPSNTGFAVAGLDGDELSRLLSSTVFVPWELSGDLMCAIASVLVSDFAGRHSGCPSSDKD